MDAGRMALCTAVVLAWIRVHWIIGQIKGLTTVANNRFAKVTQIDKSNVARLGPKWLFPPKKHGEWQAGRGYMGGTARPAFRETFEDHCGPSIFRPVRSSRKCPQRAAGLPLRLEFLSTESDLVFSGENSGSFMAVDATKVRSCGIFPRNSVWKASTVTCKFDGKQYIAMAAGQGIIGFAPPD
jgi:hypothetical protein